ncbi:unnamed protein product [Cochlearia groenlandica]
MVNQEEGDTCNNLLPLNFKWGTQRYLRCVSVESQNQNLLRLPKILIRFRLGSDLKQPPANLTAEINGGGESNGEFRETIVSDLRTERAKTPFNKRRLYDDGDDGEESCPTAETRPWKLRRRGESSKGTVFDAGEGSSDGVKRSKAAAKKTAEKRRRFTAELTKKEIEDDFLEMTGNKPPKRSKKLSKASQNRINMLYPAFYLSEITQDLYNVPESKDKRKV